MVDFSYLLAFLAIVAMLCSFLSTDYSTCLSSISTIMSIILGLTSVVYSYRCNKATEEMLKTIENRFEKVAENAHLDMKKKNLNTENMDDVKNMIKNR